MHLSYWEAMDAFFWIASFSRSGDLALSISLMLNYPRIWNQGYSLKVFFLVVDIFPSSINISPS